MSCWLVFMRGLFSSEENRRSGSGGEKGEGRGGRGEGLGGVEAGGTADRMQ